MASAPAWLSAALQSGTVLCTARNGALRCVAVKAEDGKSDLVVKEVLNTTGAAAEESRVSKVNALGPHPHILPAQLFRSASSLLIVQPRLVSSLYDHIRQQGAPSCRADALRTIDLIAQVARGVCFLHDAGVAHRGLQPHAVLLSADGTAQLSDYGSACALNEDADWPMHLSERWLPAEAHGTARFAAAPRPVPAAAAGAAPAAAANAPPSGWVAWDVYSVASIAAYALGAGKPHALLHRAWRGALGRAPHPRRRLDSLPVSSAVSALLCAQLSPVPALRPSLAQLLALCATEKENFEAWSAAPASASVLVAKLRAIGATEEFSSVSQPALEQLFSWLSSPGAAWHERLDLLLRSLPPNTPLHFPTPADLTAALSAASAKHNAPTAAAVLHDGGALGIHVQRPGAASAELLIVTVQRFAEGARCLLQGSTEAHHHTNVAAALSVALNGVQALGRSSAAFVRSALRVGVHAAPWQTVKSERVLDEALREPGAEHSAPLLKVLATCKRVIPAGGAPGVWTMQMSEPEAAAALLALEIALLKDTLFFFRVVARTDEDDALEATSAMLLLNKAESELERAKAKARQSKKPQQSKPSAPYADFISDPAPCPAAGAMSELARLTVQHGTALANGTRHESAQAVVSGGRVWRRALTGYWRSVGGVLGGVWAASANRATSQTVLIGALESGSVAWAVGHQCTDLSFHFTVIHVQSSSVQLSTLSLQWVTPLGHGGVRVLRSSDNAQTFTEEKPVEANAAPAALTELPARCTSLLSAPGLASLLGPLSGTWKLAQPDPRFPTADTSFLFELSFSSGAARPLHLLLSLLFDKQDCWIEACVARELEATKGHFFAVAAHLSAADAAAPSSEAQLRPTLQAWKKVLVERALWTVAADTISRPAKLVWRLAAPHSDTGTVQRCAVDAQAALEAELEADVWAVARAGHTTAVSAWCGARELLDAACPFEQHQYCSPVMVAATSGDVPVLRALLDRGADVRAVTAPFFSAASEWAAVRERRDVLQLLLGLPSVPVSGSLLRAAAGRVELLELLRAALNASARRKSAAASPSAAPGSGGGSGGGGKKGKAPAKAAQNNQGGKNKFAGLMDSGDS